MNTVKYNLLHETFDNEFTIERYSRFIREFFNEPEMFKQQKHTGIWKEYSDHIKSYHSVAKYTDDDDNNLIVLAVELIRDTSIDRARSMQRNFISKILDDNDIEAAIVAFYTENEPSWRLSFVRLDYSFSDKGIELDLTPAKRYSYLVGASEPNHTAEAQLLPIFEDDQHNPILDDIESAFSVEKVTKEFFNEYKDKYLDIKEYLEQDSSFIDESQKLGFEVDKFSEQFAKKLMGQLSFLYFLQKKGWLGVRIMPENHILSKDEFESIFTNQDNAHQSILTRVFRERSTGDMKLSAKELFIIDEHEAELLSDCFINTQFDMPWGSGNRTFIRKIFNSCINNTNKNFFDEYLQPLFYEALNYKRKNQYFKRFNCKIPFLNGGLFEPLEGYHWKDVNFEIPNELFSNEKTFGREANGILDIFDRFNFTMNEDEPLEKEVAVDPEMLGKIFENLLDVNDRKSKGAFYTPREIVHYMCQENLINYLVNEVNVPYEDLKEFILYGELIRDADSRSGVGFKKEFTIKQTIYNNIGKIDRALENVKVADPAVGSGAFPLGMLNEIVRARNNITEYIIRHDNEGAFNRRYGEETIRKHRSIYDMKWKTIKNSIFAVDIEPSAVDITKLRLWLSVVVDQELDESNKEPHPLPNLDMNIHVGNSLVDEYEGIKLFDKSILEKNSDKKLDKDVSGITQMSLLVDHTDEMLEEMFILQDRYFEEDDVEKKLDYKRKVEYIRDALITYIFDRAGNKEALKRYQKTLKQKVKPYFIWELEFAKVYQEKGGFDIVIGNPPYIDSEEMTKNLSDLREYCKNKYLSANGNWDLFVIFIEKGLNLLKANGTISFIVPNKLIGAKYTESLRKIMSQYTVQEIVDYSSVDVFSEADVYPIVFRIEKSTVKNDIGISIMKNKTDRSSRVIINNDLFYKDIYWDRYITDNQLNISIIEKILLGKELGNIATIKGAATVGEAYEVKEFLIDNKISDDESNFKKLINTGSIDRYVSLWGKKDTKYIKGSYTYPVISKGDIDSMNSVRLQESNAEKIIIGGMNKYLECYLDDGKYLAGKSTTIIYESTEDIYYLLGILNSKLMSFFYKNYFKTLSLNGGFLRIGPPQIKLLPIVINPDLAIDVINKTKELISSYSGNSKYNSSTLEEELNRIIYTIYGLSESEIELVDQLNNL